MVEFKRPSRASLIEGMLNGHSKFKPDCQPEPDVKQYGQLTTFILHTLLFPVFLVSLLFSLYWQSWPEVHFVSATVLEHEEHEENI